MFYCSHITQCSYTVVNHAIGQFIKFNIIILWQNAIIIRVVMRREGWMCLLGTIPSFLEYCSLSGLFIGFWDS